MRIYKRVSHNLNENRNKSECPVCCALTMTKEFIATPLDYTLRENFDINTCGECGHGVTEADKEISTESAALLYNKGSYDSKEKAWHRIMKPFLRFLESGKLKYLNKNMLKGKRLLEVGCGKGRFLELARNAGYEVYGLEPSVRSYAFAHMRLGDVVAPVTLENIDSLDRLKGPYDVIVFWHVLEHFQNPNGALKKAKKLLTNNGRIIIAVPNIASWQAAIGKANWYHLDPPRHLHHFTSESLKIILERHNLSIERLFFNSLYQNYVGDLITLINCFLPDKNVIFNMLRLNRHYINSAGLGRALFMFIAASLSTFILAVPISFVTLLSQVADKSGTMVAIVKHRKYNACL